MTESLAIAQRRAGLYLSCLAPSLDARAAQGQIVSQATRLGDDALNSANCTARHNRALGAIYTALKAGTPAGNTIRLGDKGDGSAASREEARQRQKYLNANHVPDIIRFGGRVDLFEVKCYTPFRTSRQSLGHGSARRGGAASTADGHFIAMGNTEEHLITIVLGHPARGDPDGPALDARRQHRARGCQGRALRRRHLLGTRRLPARLRIHRRHVRRRHPPAPLSRRRLQTPRGSGYHYLRRRPRIPEDLLPTPPCRHLVCYSAGRRPNHPPSRHGSRSVYGNVSGVSCEA